MPFLTYMSISGRWPKCFARPPVTEAHAWVVLETGHPMQFSQHTYFSMNLSSEVLKSCGTSKCVLLIAQGFGSRCLGKNPSTTKMCYMMCWQNIKKDLLMSWQKNDEFFFNVSRNTRSVVASRPLKMWIFLHLVRSTNNGAFAFALLWKWRFFLEKDGYFLWEFLIKRLLCYNMLFNRPLHSCSHCIRLHIYHISYIQTYAMMSSL